MNKMETTSGFEPEMEVLRTSALNHLAMPSLKTNGRNYWNRTNIFGFGDQHSTVKLSSYNGRCERIQTYTLQIRSLLLYSFKLHTEMVEVEGFKPTLYGLEDHCFILLSYTST